MGNWAYPFYPRYRLSLTEQQNKVSTGDDEEIVENGGIEQICRLTMLFGNWLLPLAINFLIFIHIGETRATIMLVRPFVIINHS